MMSSLNTDDFANVLALKSEDEAEHDFEVKQHFPALKYFKS